MGYFHAAKLLRLPFLSPFTKKHMLCMGFYHDFTNDFWGSPFIGFGKILVKNGTRFTVTKIKLTH